MKITNFNSPKSPFDKGDLRNSLCAKKIETIYHQGRRQEKLEHFTNNKNHNKLNLYNAY